MINICRIPENSASMLKIKKMDDVRQELNSVNSSPQRSLSGGDETESEDEGDGRPRGKISFFTVFMISLKICSGLVSPIWTKNKTLDALSFNLHLLKPDKKCPLT